MKYLDRLNKTESKVMEALKMLGVAFLGSMLIALAKPFTFFFPFTVIPVTAQATVALIVGLLLGKERGTLAVAFFLMQGLLGLPVVGSGAQGLAVICGPTAGYLLGYLLAAPLMGTLKSSTSLSDFSLLLVGNLTLYLFGAAYLATFVGLSKAISLGVLPFIGIDLLKLLAFSELYRFHSSR